MKILIYGDAHFSLNSSILIGSTNSLSGKLDHLIKSFEWMYELARNNNVERIVDLGDLVDSYILRAEEITAVSTALGNNKEIPEYHILGNHERLSEEGKINSVSFVNNIQNHKLITEVTYDEDMDALFIPYGKYESGCFDEYKPTKYAFSHIDIFGSDTGGWSLKSGLDPVYMTTRFGLTINGHIHNGSWVIKDKILNLGSISGQNFSSKSINWKPSVAILDTDTNSIKLYENPYSLNFINKSCKTVSEVVNLLNSFDGDRSYAIQLKVPISIADDVRKMTSEKSNIIASKVMMLIDEKELGGLTYDEVDKVNSIEGGFKKLIDFVNDQESLPYNKEDILKVVSELEENKLVC
jgi:hypothetical protein